MSGPPQTKPPKHEGSGALDGHAADERPSIQAHVQAELRSFTLDLSLSLGRETVAVVGASGAGKTTLLRILAGLHRGARGRILVGEAEPTAWLDADHRVDVAPERRAVGYVPQEHGLFTHLSVRENVRFGARSADAADRWLDRLGLAPLASAKPGGLSGGERQRTALARALAREPRLLLLDEPLGGLDAATRLAVRAQLGEHLRAARLPTLLVTHAADDAWALADRIAVVDRGRIVQLATPGQLRAEPHHPAAAAFVGAHLLPGAGGDLHACFPWELELRPEDAGWPPAPTVSTGAATRRDDRPALARGRVATVSWHGGGLRVGLLVDPVSESEPAILEVDLPCGAEPPALGSRGLVVARTDDGESRLQAPARRD